MLGEGFEEIRLEQRPPRPKLLALLKLPFPRVRKQIKGEKIYEKINRVAFDTDGQAWGLVERATPLPNPPGTPAPRAFTYPPAYRNEYVRWVRFDAIPFAPGELVTADAWPSPPPEVVE